MPAILENILVMILTIVVPLTAIYLFLLLVAWGLKMKSGGREKQELTDLWIATQTDVFNKKADGSDFKKDRSTDRSS